MACTCRSRPKVWSLCWRQPHLSTLQRYVPPAVLCDVVLIVPVSLKAGDKARRNPGSRSPLVTALPYNADAAWTRDEVRALGNLTRPLLIPRSRSPWLGPHSFCVFLRVRVIACALKVWQGYIYLVFITIVL